MNPCLQGDQRRSGAGREGSGAGCEQGLVERLALPDQHEAVTRAVLNVERRRRSRDTSNRRSRDTPFAVFVIRTVNEQRLQQWASSIPRMPYGQRGDFMQKRAEQAA